MEGHSHGRVSGALIALLGAGFLLRLLLAYVFLPQSGYFADFRFYSHWTGTLLDVGPGGFYENVGFSDYPPGYLYVLWLLGTIDQALAHLTGAYLPSVILESLKIPPMLIDACTAFAIYRLVHRWPGLTIHRERTALAAAAIYTFNPVVWYDSAIWGQTDSVGAFVLVLTVLSLMRGPPEVAAGIAVLAGLLKPQFGVIAVPLVAVVLLKRYLSREARSQWMSAAGPVRLVSSALAAVVVLYALIAPFHLTITSLFERMTSAAATYSYLTVNAYNPWALVGRPPLFASGLGTFKHDDILLLGSIQAVTVGATLLALGFCLGAARLVWRSDVRSLVLVGAYLCLCFFILPTRVHERYLFPAFAFLSVLAAVDRKWFGLTVALTMGSLINLHAVLTQVTQGSPSVVALPLGDICRSPIGVTLSIALQTTVFGLALWRLRPAPTGCAETSAVGAANLTAST
jgi:Gpi18-like mannosyltransferase